MHQKKAMDNQPIYNWLMHLVNSLLSLNRKIKNNTKEICDHIMSGIGNHCFICEDSCSGKKEIRPRMEE